MSQLFLIYNYDKDEYIHPHDFADKAGLVEFGAGNHGTMMALALLLRSSNRVGDIGSDFQGNVSRLLGRWCGDRISIVGDLDTSGSYDSIQDKAENIGIQVILLMATDPFLKEELKLRLSWRIKTLPAQQAKALGEALGIEVT